jgi:acetoin utilization deacetylase AcuC-like enzyme
VARARVRYITFLFLLTVSKTLQFTPFIMVCCCLRFCSVIGGSKWMEPTEFWENSHTKRRIHNLLSVSGLIESLTPVRARPASKEEITRFHTERYHDQIEQDSQNRGGDGGELAPFSHGGYDIASLSAGGVLAATEAVLKGDVENAYCLVRPPGHHAEADRGRGFCLFNNVALAALHARTMDAGVQRIAIVDYGKKVSLPCCA